VEHGQRFDMSLHLYGKCMGGDRECILSVTRISRLSYMMLVGWWTYGEGRVDAWHIVVSDEDGRVVESYVVFAE
jgi:hypothetical protein